MGVLKILVLCVVILVALCEESVKPELKPTTAVDTRYKRETEIDVHTRERIAKLPCRSRNIRPVIQKTKNLNIINAFSHNALPRKNILPVAVKPKSLSTTEKRIKHSEVDDDVSYSCDATELNKVESMIAPINNLATSDIKNENGDEDKQNSDGNDIEGVKGKFVQDDSKPTKPDREIKVERDEAKEQNNEIIDQTKDTNLAATDDNNNKQSTIKKADKEINQVTTKEIETSEENSDDKLPSANLLSNFKIVPGIPSQRSETPVKVGIKSNLINRENAKITRNEIKEVNDDDDPKIAILPDAGKMPIKNISRQNPPKVLLIPKSPIKLPNESDHSISETPQESIENHDKKAAEKKNCDVPINLLKIEQDEMELRNNQYEELYEASTPQYNAPKVITSDLRPTADWNTFSEAPTNYEYSNSLQTYNENKPYSYEIKKYPHQYVVNTYDNINRRQNNIDGLLNNNIKNEENVGGNPYTKIASPRSQQYNYDQPQSQAWNQRSCQYNQGQEYPKIIRRSWKNNQIFIRPKYGNTFNTDLYKGLGSHIANANAQSRANNSNRVSSSGNENQNTSPRLNPFQYRFYGY